MSSKTRTENWPRNTGKYRINVSDFDIESGEELNGEIKVDNNELIKWLLIIGSIFWFVFVIIGSIALISWASKITKGQGNYL